MASRALLVQIKRCLSSSSGDAIRRTALYDFHVANKGKMVPFAGWLMPVQYGSHGIIESHLHTRKSAGLFDVSHMLQTRVTGKDAASFMESVVVADVKGLPPGRGTLTVMTTDQGRIIDDLIVTRAREGYLYVVSNAGCAEKDWAHFQRKLKEYNAKNPQADVNMVVIEGHSLLALQGPAMKAVLQQGITDQLAKLPFMNSIETKVFGVDKCRVTRCGYTGEDGVEISVPSKHAVQLAEALLKHDAVRLAGLGARDTLRLEAGLCLYGSDIDEKTTPIEAGLAWLIAKRRRQSADFPGAAVILGQLKDSAKVKQRRVGLKSLSGPPARHDTKVVLADDPKKVVGHVTSGTMAVSLPKTNIAMAYVGTPYLKETKLAVEVRGRVYGAEITKMPFVPTNYFTPA